MLRPLYSIVLLILLVSCEQTKPEALKSAVTEFPATPHYKVGFLIMDGVYNTELTAPYDIFQHTVFREGIKPMIPFTLSKNLDPVTTFEGMRILPDYAYTGNHPEIDILVVPSAEGHLSEDLRDTVMLNFVKRAATDAEWVTSHCDGAFVLAKAGLLDERVSTTFPSDIGQYRSMFPQLAVKDSMWFVHDGKYITSAGGARSFEAALYLCDLLYGPEITQSLASGLVLKWEPEKIPHFILPRAGNGRP